MLPLMPLSGPCYQVWIWISWWWKEWFDWCLVMCFSGLDSCYMTFKAIQVPLYSYRSHTNKTQHSQIHSTNLRLPKFLIAGGSILYPIKRLLHMLWKLWRLSEPIIIWWHGLLVCRFHTMVMWRFIFFLVSILYKREKERREEKKRKKESVDHDSSMSLVNLMFVNFKYRVWD